MTTVASKTIKIEGRDVLYYTAGHGEPLVVIHGGGGDARTWIQNMEELAKNYTVYAPDLPGYGGSQPMEGNYYIPELAGFVGKFTEAIGLEKFYLVGHSLGGGIALDVALLFPQKIRKLVLISSLCLGREIAFWVRLLSLPAMIKTIGKVFLGIMKGVKWVFNQLNPAKLIMEMTPAAMMVGCSISTLHEQSLVLESRLGEVTMPTLLVWGGRDPIVPVMQAYRAAKIIPNCAVRVFKKRGHNVHRDELKEFSNILTRFLD